jgi:hypothetical protein
MAQKAPHPIRVAGVTLSHRLTVVESTNPEIPGTVIFEFGTRDNKQPEVRMTALRAEAVKVGEHEVELRICPSRPRSGGGG